MTSLLAFKIIATKLEKLSKTNFALLFVLIIGVMSRIAHVNLSFWLDESWVANSVTSNSLSQMFYYDSWLQTSPPLFLLLVRYTIKFYGESHFTFRVIPILFGVLSIILFIFFSKKFFGRNSVLLCVVLLAINPTAVRHSINLKQYSTDLFSAILLLLTTYKYLKEESVRNYVILLLSFGISLFLSYTAVFLVPCGVYGLAVRPWRLWASENKLNMHNTYLKSNIRLLLFIFIVCIATIVNYISFIRPNTYPHLFSFWGSEFPPRGTILDTIIFYVKSLPNFSGLFIPNMYLNMEIRLAILFVILVGLIRMIISFLQKEQIHSELFILICLPFLSLIAANIMGKYPYGATEANFFILPVFLILFVYGIICFRNLLQWLLKKDFGEIIEYSFQTLCIFTSMIFLYLVSSSNIVLEDAKGAVKYLQDNIGVEDSLYVHASMVEQFKLYCRMLNCVNGTYYYGKTGAPCCIRKENIDLGNNAYDLQNDLHSFMRYNKVKTRWFLFTGRSVHWRRIGRDESEIIENILKSVNCEEKLRKRFDGVLIYSFNCN